MLGRGRGCGPHVDPGAQKKWPQQHGGRSSDEDARGDRKQPRAVDRAVGDKGQAEGRDLWGIVNSGRALR